MVVLHAGREVNRVLKTAGAVLAVMLTGETNTYAETGLFDRKTLYRAGFALAPMSNNSAESGGINQIERRGTGGDGNRSSESLKGAGARANEVLFGCRSGMTE